MSILYLVSTPIGNLEDITLRAKRILAEVAVIAAEDTRKAGLLLKLLGIESKQRLISYFEGNELKRIPELINLLKQGQSIALISNAGTPAIADPGFKLVREAIKNGIEVVSVPGASAILTALPCSGLPTDKFLFLGYLPKKQGKKKKLLEKLTTILQSMIVTVIIYESPYRLLKTLGEIKEVFGEIEIVICRELTKIHEEERREKISEAIEHFQKIKPKGELTVIFSPSGSLKVVA